MRECILNHFPGGTTVSDPKGGIVLWIELPPGFDTFDLYSRALKENIVIAPGCIFSLTGKFNNVMRLNAGVWNERVKAAIVRLGELLARK